MFFSYFSKGDFILPLPASGCFSSILQLCVQTGGATGKPGIAPELQKHTDYTCAATETQVVTMIDKPESQWITVVYRQ